MPSPIISSPDGIVTTVTDTVVGEGIKFAVTNVGSCMVKVQEFDVLLQPLQELKVYPLLAVAVKITESPGVCQHPAEQSGLTLPAPDGFTAVVSWYNWLK